MFVSYMLMNVCDVLKVIGMHMIIV